MTDHTTMNPVTQQDETIVRPCPKCGTDVSRTIPAGTRTALAKMLRGVELMCASCADADDKVEREREHLRLRRQREDRCQLPHVLRGLTFESYNTDRVGAGGALAAARGWSQGKHEKPGLLIVGPVGVGKTRLAATALWAALGDWENRPLVDDPDVDAPLPGRDVRYVNVAELIVKLSASFGDRERGEALRLLTGKGALVLDDLDKVNPSQQVLAHLYTAIDGRVQAGAPLIVTTNLDPKALVEKFARPGRGEDPAERRVAAEAIVSRLIGHCTVHGIQGADGRRS